MHPTIRNILAIVAGLIVGSVVNRGIIGHGVSDKKESHDR